MHTQQHSSTSSQPASSCTPLSTPSHSLTTLPSHTHTQAKYEQRDAMSFAEEMGVSTKTASLAISFASSLDKSASQTTSLAMLSGKMPVASGGGPGSGVEGSLPPVDHEPPKVISRVMAWSKGGNRPKTAPAPGDGGGGEGGNKSFSWLMADGM